MVNLSMIPTNLHDFYTINPELNKFNKTVMEHMGANRFQRILCRHYSYSYIFYTIACIYQTNLDTDNTPIAFQYLRDCNNYLTRCANGGECPEETCGLIINEEASTHFDPIDIKNPRFLTAAEEHLKQTPNHFLKIFTTEHINTLFVYTNKELEPKTVFKLLLLEASMHNKDNTLFTVFIEALLAEDTIKVNRILNDYLCSDTLNEEKYRHFTKTITSNNDRRIQSCQNQITEKRNTILAYENTIAQFATEIRELSEQIQFLKEHVDEDETNRKLFKYLIKHPYIKDFRPRNEGEIVFHIESPIVYYNTVPIEKYREQSFRSETDQAIFDLFLSNEYELWTKTCIVLDTRSFRIYTERFTIDNKELLPQPHIMEFQCFGNHRTAIAESAERHDYLGAIEQISQATMNLNFYDSCVIDRMLERLRGRYIDRNTWKEKSTGRMVSTHDAIITYRETHPIEERSTNNEEA